MKGKIKVTTNGYWYSNDCLYLDEYNYETNKIIEFEDFEKHFHLWDYERDWQGNNPFTKDECLRLWINDNSRVEIIVLKREGKTKFIIYKIVKRDYEKQNDLIIDLMKLDNLYKDVLSTFNKYVEEYILGGDDND